MSGPDLQAVQRAIALVRLDDRAIALAEVAEIAAVQARGNALVVSLRTRIPMSGLAAPLGQELGRALGTEVQLQLDPQIIAGPRRAGTAALERVANVIAVASGKGGVGKSTTAV